MFLSAYPLFSAILALFAAPPEAVSVSRVTISEEVVMRIPVIRPHFAWPIRWEETKGPRCIKSDNILATALADDGSIDFLMRSRERIRARLENQCPTLDFYGGLYLQSADGSICARRDEVRSRIGGACAIERFRRMVPHPIR
ncbi:hypothetical protein M8312_03000 [Sphingomonas sp. KRR8]|uniref:hypothetical protein n=1 Tax=Sphingomonas sp. KRR8 TaxID=2942996 RepID=UPI002021F7D3|nr:hypothetical protein [Sphingomonas sp. KRR8]URD61499.1 hypothetical protein M8312_03000 [Sphingomonas sp. KRR8]